MKSQRCFLQKSATSPRKSLLLCQGEDYTATGAHLNDPATPESVLTNEDAIAEQVTVVEHAFFPSDWTTVVFGILLTVLLLLSAGV